MIVRLLVFLLVALPVLRMRAQNTVPLLPVNQLTGSGVTIPKGAVATHGFVVDLNLTKKIFLISGDSIAGPSSTTANTLLVDCAKWDSTVNFPKKGSDIVVVGTLDTSSNRARLTPIEMITSPDRVKQIVAEGNIHWPAQKRPGDNLGRDARFLPR